MPDDQPQQVEPRTLRGREVRALAHPLRLRMLEALREEPATASILARRLNESTGATSYHLRELARHGFIEEEPDRGTARERWWRRRERMLLDRAESRPGARDGRRLRAAAEHLPRARRRGSRALGAGSSRRPGGSEAAMIGNWNLHATPEEVEALTEKVVALVDELRRAARRGACGCEARPRQLPCASAGRVDWRPKYLCKISL